MEISNQTIDKLANLAQLQFSEKERADIKVDLEKGENNSLLQWLRTNIHSHGKKYAPKELILNVTGAPLSHEPFMRYVKNKYSQIYDI